MSDIQRPTAYLRTKRGLAAYNPAEVAAFRAANGVTAEELAAHVGTQRPGIARWESTRYGPLAVKAGDRLIVAVEKLAASRARLVAKGLRDLEDIRANRTYAPGDRLVAYVESDPDLTDEDRAWFRAWIARGMPARDEEATR